MQRRLTPTSCVVDCLCVSPLVLVTNGSDEFPCHKWIGHQTELIKELGFDYTRLKLETPSKVGRRRYPSGGSGIQSGPLEYPKGKRGTGIAEIRHS